MKKLTYTNDQQLINDAAQMLIENHLRWSNSGAGVPSDDREGVLDEMVNALVNNLLEKDASNTRWRDLDEETQNVFLEASESKADRLYPQAAQLADRKWQAAIALLGI